MDRGQTPLVRKSGGRRWSGFGVFSGISDHTEDPDGEFGFVRSIRFQTDDIVVARRLRFQVDDPEFIPIPAILFRLGHADLDIALLGRGYRHDLERPGRVRNDLHGLRQFGSHRAGQSDPIRLDAGETRHHSRYGQVLLRFARIIGEHLDGFL